MPTTRAARSPARAPPSSAPKPEAEKTQPREKQAELDRGEVKDAPKVISERGWGEKPPPFTRSQLQHTLRNDMIINCILAAGFFWLLSYSAKFVKVVCAIVCIWFGIHILFELPEHLNPKPPDYIMRAREMEKKAA